jgi:hypothetical protein
MYACLKALLLSSAGGGVGCQLDDTEVVRLECMRRRARQISLGLAKFYESVDLIAKLGGALTVVFLR